MSLHIQKKVFFFFVFLKVFKLLSKCDKFQVNKYHVPIQKKKVLLGNCTPTPTLQWLPSQNTMVGIELIELTEPSDTLNHSPFLNIAFYKLLYTYCYFSYLCEKKYFVLEIELYLILSWFVAFVGWYSVLLFSMFCVSGAFFYKVIVN